MAKPLPSPLVLVEKIVRAKVRLEAGKVSHKSSCATEDLESTAPCNCGAGTINATLNRALQELNLKELE